ncbi:F-box protein [Mesorhizobium sp. M0674]|uniref:F-box protein n=1 Tax=unclassified Mesorhizobium TaxID=325217 RepID=UPI003335DA42
MPLDILVDIAERLSPMDLLRISHTNQELRVAAMIVATPQERRIQVQAICGSPCTGLQRRLILLAEDHCPGGPRSRRGWRT